MKLLKKFKWSSIKLGYKYGVALLITIVLFLISTGVTVTLLYDTKEKIDIINERGDRAIKITEMGSIFRSKDIVIADYIYMGVDRYIDEYKQLTKQFEKLESQLASQMDSKDLKKHFNEIDEMATEVDTIFHEKIVPAVEDNNKAILLMKRSKISTLRDMIINHLTEIRKDVNQEREGAITGAIKDMGNVLWVLIGSILVSTLLGSAIIYLISKRISANLDQIVDINNQMAEGSLKVEKMDYDGQDEIGQLAQAQNRMIDNLKGMINQVRYTSENVGQQSQEMNHVVHKVKDGSMEIASTMEQMSAGSQEQAASATEIANSVQRLNQLIEGADQDGELLEKKSHNVLKIAEQGEDQMSRSVQQMERINGIFKNSVEKVQKLARRSQDISGLVGVIKDIAEQTNLLSLNASIEAARAGEAGQGFAVVAEEIRQLADQVANSITEITEIVDGIQTESSQVTDTLEKGYKQVENGTEQIRITGDSFHDIIEAVSEMVDRIEDVSKNLKDISESSNGINTSVQHVASVTEENSAGIEEMSAMVEEQDNSMERVSNNADTLSELAEQLQDMISQFEL